MLTIVQGPKLVKTLTGEVVPWPRCTCTLDPKTVCALHGSEVKRWVKSSATS